MTTKTTLAPHEHPPGIMVYEFWAETDDGGEGPHSGPFRAFLERHGIGLAGPSFINGNPLRVLKQPDGTFWVDAWRAVGDDGREAPLCPHCPACVQQERIWVPLNGQVPLMPGAYVREDTGLPVVSVTG